MAYQMMVSGTVATGDVIANTSTKTRFATVLNMPPTSDGLTATGASEQRVGQSFDVELAGVISTTGTPGTLTVTIDHGGNTDGLTLTVLGTTGAFTPPASLSGAMWTLKGRVVYNTTGHSTGLATFVGVFTIIKSDNTVLCYPMISTGSGTTGMTSSINTDTYVYNIIGMAVTWQTAASGNTITMAAGSMIRRVT